jgi:hypothetical protein
MHKVINILIIFLINFNKKEGIEMVKLYLDLVKLGLRAVEENTEGIILVPTFLGLRDKVKAALEAEKVQEATIQNTAS